jgi:hypothetical protein
MIPQLAEILLKLALKINQSIKPIYDISNMCQLTYVGVHVHVIHTFDLSFTCYI